MNVRALLKQIIKNNTAAAGISNGEMIKVLAKPKLLMRGRMNSIETSKTFSNTTANGSMVKVIDDDDDSTYEAA